MSITSTPERVSSLRLDGVRRDAVARTVVRRWRAHTGGAPTLVACSGGADSTALALILQSVGAPISLGHVVHDMRPAAEAHADAGAVQSLADRLGTPLHVDEAARVPGMNVEASLRTARYAALARLARRAGASTVVSAHHADDQWETVLLALVRGAGPAGLAGVAPERALAPDVRVVRPMLEARRTDSERLCTLAGVEWVDDPTNRDTQRARAAIRAEVTPALLRLHPHAPDAASRAAALLRDAAGLIADRADEVFGDGHAWDRSQLRAERAVIVGEGLRRAALRLTHGAGADRLSVRRVRQAVDAVRDADGGRRTFDWPMGVRLVITRAEVSMSRLFGAEGDES